MKKLPHDLRLATLDERPAFNATGTCIAIRIYEKAEPGKGFAFCSDRRAPDEAGTAGLCIDHARQLLDPNEWSDPGGGEQAAADEEKS